MYPRSPSHVAWVQKHFCSIPECKGADIREVHLHQTVPDGPVEFECDRYVVSLCADHRSEFYERGEKRFQRSLRVDLMKIADEFVASSPYKDSLFEDRD